MIISERTKELVDKFIQQSYKEIRGWSMKEVLVKVKRAKGSVDQAKQYIVEKYYESRNKK
tara:strand:- start:227 stop:406 length:180 start_codon:yes stop_codon:yes gene_type:complete